MSDPALAPAFDLASPYAALAPDAQQRLAEARAAYFAQESRRLDALKEALWQAFEASPSVSLPVPLIDLVSAYTHALKLSLVLRGAAELPSRNRLSVVRRR